LPTDVLAHAPDPEPPYFRVPKVIERVVASESNYGEIEDDDELGPFLQCGKPCGEEGFGAEIAAEHYKRIAARNPEI